MSLSSGAAVGRGDSNDRTRRHNLSVILRLVHRAAALSRSELTRASGLNRSTIAALVGELVERELVVETEPDSRNQVGRPSPVVRAGSTPLAIAVNPEIDAVTLAIVGLGGQVLRRVRQVMATVPTAREAVETTAAVIAGWGEEYDLDRRLVGIGAAIPGLVRANDSLVRLAPHLGWVNEPFATELEKATGFTVRASNDASLGVVAEREFGGGVGVDDLIYLNGGASGIGGGILSRGRLLGGADGYAGELGHTLVTDSGIACHCGATGCLETEVRRDRLIELMRLGNVDADEMEAALLSTDSPAVKAEIDRQLGYLAVALRNATNLLNPRLILLGGFLGSLLAADTDRLERSVRERALAGPGDGVVLGRARLGANILLIGAAELAFERVLGDPTLF